MKFWPVRSKSPADHVPRIAELASGDDGYLERLCAEQHTKLSALFADHGRATDRVLELLERLGNKQTSNLAAVSRRTDHL